MTARAPLPAPIVQPLAFALLLLLAVDLLAVERVLRRLPSEYATETNKRVFKDFLRHESGADSWYPMTVAYQHHLAHPGAPLYAQVFFENRVKFQYPPSSLLLWRALHLAQPGAMNAAWFEGGAYRDAHRAWWGGLDAAMWWCVWLTALVGASIFDAAWRRWPPRGDVPIRVRDRAVAAVAVFGLAAYFYPLLRTYTLGQIQAALTALGAISVLCWVRGWRGAAGALLGVVCLVKPQTGLVLVWAILRREWRFVVGFLVTATPLALWSLAEFGWDAHVEYLRVLGFIARHGEGYFPNQSVNGLLLRALGLGNNLEWEGETFAPYHPLVAWGTLLSSLAMILVALWPPPKPRRAATPDEGADAPGDASGDATPRLADFLLVLVVAILASPVAWEHHYSLLVPVFAAAAPALMRRRPLGRATGHLLALSVLVSAHFIGAAMGTADTPYTVLQSYLFGAGLVAALLLWALRRAPAGDPPTTKSPRLPDRDFI